MLSLFHAKVPLLYLLKTSGNQEVYKWNIDVKWVKIALLPENIRLPLRFFMFSGVRERVHWEQMD